MPTYTIHPLQPASSISTEQHVSFRNRALKEVIEPIGRAYQPADMAARTDFQAKKQYVVVETEQPLQPDIRQQIEGKGWRINNEAKPILD